VTTGKDPQGGNEACETYTFKKEKRGHFRTEEPVGSLDGQAGRVLLRVQPSGGHPNKKAGVQLSRG